MEEVVYDETRTREITNMTNFERELAALGLEKQGCVHCRWPCV